MTTNYEPKLKVITCACVIQVVKSEFELSFDYQGGVDVLPQKCLKDGIYIKLGLLIVDNLVLDDAEATLIISHVLKFHPLAEFQIVEQTGE